MPTWDQYYRAEETRAKRAVQDQFLRRQQREFDLAAQDKTPKSARHHWAVVGEGSAASQDNFRRNYDLIDWSRA